MGVFLFQHHTPSTTLTHHIHTPHTTLTHHTPYSHTTLTHSHTTHHTHIPHSHSPIPHSHSIHTPHTHHTHTHRHHTHTPHATLHTSNSSLLEGFKLISGPLWRHVGTPFPQIKINLVKLHNAFLTFKSKCKYHME